MSNNLVELADRPINVPEIKYLKKSSLVKGRVCICVGTRPSFMKMAPLIQELEKRGFDLKILHTGQHYSPELDIYWQLKLPKPDCHVKGLENYKSHGEQTAFILREAEKYFLKIKPEMVLVCGDANLNFACGLAARKLRLTLGHVESGLRNYDWRTPEEHNRRMLDHISELLFAPTLHSMQNLARENVPGKICLTGNTIVEALNKYLPEQERKKELILLTLHREENVDDPETLENTLKGIMKVKELFSEPIIFPIHPRTRKRVKEFGLAHYFEEIRILDPVPYAEFLSLMLRSRLILTDSGGVQEEACILGVPCVVLRETTDRPESVEVGASKVAGSDPDRILSCAKEMDGRFGWGNPFDPYGDGEISRGIVDCISAYLRKESY